MGLIHRIGQGLYRDGVQKSNHFYCLECSDVITSELALKRLQPSAFAFKILLDSNWILRY